MLLEHSHDLIQRVVQVVQQGRTLLKPHQVVWDVELVLGAHNPQLHAQAVVKEPTQRYRTPHRLGHAQTVHLVLTALILEVVCYRNASHVQLEPTAHQLVKHQSLPASAV